MSHIELNRKLKAYCDEITSRARATRPDKTTSEYKLLQTDLETHKKTNPEAVTKILANQERGDYGDFTSDYAFPKSILCEELKKAGLTDLMQKALKGEYDF